MYLENVFLLYQDNEQTQKYVFCKYFVQHVLLKRLKSLNMAASIHYWKTLPIGFELLIAHLTSITVFYIITTL